MSSVHGCSEWARSTEYFALLRHVKEKNQFISSECNDPDGSDSDLYCFYGLCIVGRSQICLTLALILVIRITMKTIKESMD
eukprot:scaffold2079_cov66-Cyclotella_meneghiniana.AAC.3